MKRILTTLMVMACLWIAIPAQAQLKFGLKGGLNISTFTFSRDVFKGDNRTGFFVGPMAELTIPVIGIGVDVAALYNQAKGEIIRSGSATEEYTLKSIEIPVNLKWSFGLGSTMGAYIAAGPQFGFNVGTGLFNIGSDTFDMSKSSTTFNVGAGLKFIQHWQLGVNYNFGLSKWGRTTFESEEGDVEMKRNTWQISLAYLF